MAYRQVAFILLILFCLSPWGSAPLALALGIIVAVTFRSPFPGLAGKPTKYLLQASVVLLGFGMDVRTVYEAGRDGIFFTIATIFGTLALGYFVGKQLNVGSKTSALISSGTAICGGSAIAAVGPAIDAEADEISVSLGTVFVLNSIALFLFPIIGHALGLTQGQFGVWAAIAIHDTSSVVGAADTYGQEALNIATTVKLARALWIAPVALLFAYLYRRNGRTNSTSLGVVPWFIGLFLIATAIRTKGISYMFPSLMDALVNLGKAGMIITLFLIGTGLSPNVLRKVGFRPLLQGVLLWAVISAVSLFAILNLL